MAFTLGSIVLTPSLVRAEDGSSAVDDLSMPSTEEQKQSEVRLFATLKSTTYFERIPLFSTIANEFIVIYPSVDSLLAHHAEGEDSWGCLKYGRMP